MIVEECPPSLGGRVAAADYILAHARLADVDAQLEQLAVNPQSALEWVLTTYGANQRTHLFRYAGRPGLPCRTFQAQNKRMPFRCQPMTVDALTAKMLDCQSFQTAHSQAHSHRSVGVSFGSLTER